MDQETPPQLSGSTVHRNSGSDAFKSPLTRPLLVAAAYDDGCVTVWEITTDSDTPTVKHRFWPHCTPNSVDDVGVDVSGSLLTVRSNQEFEHKVFVWNLASGQLLYVFGEFEVKLSSFIARSLFSCKGHMMAVNVEDFSGDGACHVLESTTGAIICSIKEDHGRSITSYIFVDDDNYIITCEFRETGARCWSAHSGQRVKSHWAESFTATVVCTNASADKIFFLAGRNNSYSCVTSEGEVLATGMLKLGGSLSGFINEDTVIFVDTFGISDVKSAISLVNVVTGSVSKYSTNAPRQRFAVRSSVGNAASKILIGHGLRVHVVSARHDGVGETMGIIEDSLRSSAGRVVAACGVELDCVVLM
jgi:WD40 repeat protein